MTSETVGVIGDTHIPYEHRGYLEFCKRIFDEQGVTRVIQIGDLVDHHALSFHDSEPCLVGANGELTAAACHLKKWYDAFPELEMVMGNHDKIPARKLKKIGLDPDVFLKPLGELYSFPNGWSCNDRIISNGVLYTHGEATLGTNGFRNYSLTMGVNTVTGHAHSNFGVSYSYNGIRTVWGCAVGCGIDQESAAFLYGVNARLKPVLGCAVILDNGRLPVCFPMEM